MKNPSSRDSSQDARLEDNDALWQLLGKAPLARPGPWFVTQVLAQCRQAGSQAEKAGISFLHLWRWALGGGLAVCLATLLVFKPAASHVDLGEKQKENVQEAFQIMASINSDASSPSLWQDSSL